MSSTKTSPNSAARSTASSSIEISVRNVCVIIGDEHILDNVSFDIHAGEFIGLIGPNGAGKSTLLNVVLGLMTQTRGKVKLGKPKIGYIQQRGFMQDTQVPVSVLEVVLLGSRGDKTLAYHSLDEVGMKNFATKRFGELSGGQQQRVLIAKALAADPGVLILDEPTTGIDEHSQSEFYEILKQLEAKGITVIMVSHDVEIIQKLVSRMICLNRTILYDGKPEDFDETAYMEQLYSHAHHAPHHAKEAGRV